jgi:tight adherence protein B
VSLESSVLVISTVAGIAAVIILFGPDRPARPARPIDPDIVPRLLASVGVGALVLTFSGWLIASLVVVIGCWFAVGRWQRRDRRAISDVERTDALASWIENLRDVLVAGDQPVGAINATVATCPPAIRPQVRRLAAGLLIAIQRGARTAAVLSSLAEQARRQADRRRLVEAERAPIQREVTLLTLIMGSLIVAVLVFGRAEYLAPYDTAGGQLFLGMVLAIYALLLVRVQRLAHFPRPSRFLTTAEAPTRSDDPIRSRQ